MNVSVFSKKIKNKNLFIVFLFIYTCSIFLHIYISNYLHWTLFFFFGNNHTGGENTVAPDGDDDDSNDVKKKFFLLYFTYISQ